MNYKLKPSHIVPAYLFVVGCGASRTPRPTVFVGDEMSLGGSLVEDGGFEPP